MTFRATAVPCRKSDRRNCFSHDRFFIEALSGHVQMMVTNTNRQSHITTMFLNIWRKALLHAHTHARGPTCSQARIESWHGFGPLKGWVDPQQHTCTHKRASLCVPCGVPCVFASWTCICRVPTWSSFWLGSKQKCLETRIVHHSGGSAWRYTLQNPACIGNRP